MSELTNTDFRVLLNQADKDVLADLTQPRKKKTVENASTAKERHKQRYLQIIKRQKQRERSLQEKETQSGSQWRDRAAERRNASGDYARIAEEYQMLKDRTEEESKFLGGDEEHTHLVKGLDYRLLEKVRAEIEKKEVEKKSRQVQEGTPHQIIHQSLIRQEQPKGSTTSLLAKKICSELVEQVHPHHLSFQKKLQRIESVVLRGAHFRGNTTNFRPGRMIYQFNLGNHTELSKSDEGVPVIVFHSLDEAYQKKHSVHGVIAPVHEKILSDLTDALEWAAQNKKGGKRLGDRRSSIIPKDEELYSIAKNTVAEMSTKWTHNNEKRHSTNSDEEKEDIFGGVGRYDPSEVHDGDAVDPGIESSENGGLPNDHHNYFGGIKEESVEKEVEDVLPHSLTSKLESVRHQGGEDAVEARRRRAIDDYDECYPGVGAEWIEKDVSDEEDQKKKRKPRAEDDTGGEKKKPKLTARALRRQNEREWKQIEKMMESKEGNTAGLDAFANEIKEKSNSHARGTKTFTVL